MRSDATLEHHAYLFADDCELDLAPAPASPPAAEPWRRKRGSLARALIPAKRFTVDESPWRRRAIRWFPFPTTQLNWRTRRSPMNGLCPCQELSLRLKQTSVPPTGGTSATTASRS